MLLRFVALALALLTEAPRGAASATAANGCPVGFSYLFNGSCYLKTPSSSRSMSQSACTRSGGWLVTISSPEELNHITTIFGDGYWNGLTIGADGVWRWDQSSTLNVTCWANGQPGEGVYGVTTSSGCVSHLDAYISGICEARATVSTPTPPPSRPSSTPRIPSIAPTGAPTLVPSQVHSSSPLDPCTDSSFTPEDK
jgi:hypothetical protein